MERIYWIVGTILLIIGILGSMVRILISSSPWLPDIGVALGIVGLVGSRMTFLAGASSGQLAEFRKEAVSLLKEIRDLLRRS